MSEIEYDQVTGATIVNMTDLPDEEIERGLRADADIGRIIANWSLSNDGRSSRGKRSGGIFNRDRWVTPDNIFDKFRVAADAARTDDVVSGVVETTEQLAFRQIMFESTSRDEESIWNQVADDINLEQTAREIWREVFTVSQCYVATLWGARTYTPRDKLSEGDSNVRRRKRRKEYVVRVPVAISLLDPMKVVPVGNFMFGQERLAYIANPEEAARFNETLAGGNSSDLVVTSLIESKYTPTKEEKNLIQAVTGRGVPVNLFLLNKDAVFRITSSRPSYQRFADVRMEAVFELLDLKQQLRQMDRASLMGSINAIILVKRGTDALPAKPQEVQDMRVQFGGSQQRPVIISDHRLSVEIVTPKTDKTLAAERHNMLDSRVTSRLYQLFSAGSYVSGAAQDTSIGLMKVVSASMEARRDLIRDALMNNIFDLMYEKNPTILEKPTLNFYPSRISLDFDPNVALFMQQLRDRGEISQTTMLGEVGLRIEDEAVKRQREVDVYDEIFTPPNNVPYDGDHVGPAGNGGPGKDASDPGPGARKTEQRKAGRTGGGNNNGGGNNLKSALPVDQRKS